MEINSFNVNRQKNYSSPSFGDRYPVRDVMCIMSGSEVIGKRSDTFDSTVAGILHKKVGKTAQERGKDYLHAMEYLSQKYTNLRKFAEKFRNMLDTISHNHYAITTEDEKLVSTSIEQQIGSKFLDLY